MSTESSDPATVIGWMDELSNWNRWGSDDLKGTLNYITGEVRARAAAEVQTGRSLGLGWDIRAAPRLGGVANRWMSSNGETTRVSEAAATGMHAAADIWQLQYHHQDVTHIDALSHIFFAGKMYNDRSASLVSATNGAAQLSIEHLRDGVVTRGVLLDVAAAQPDSRMELRQAAYPSDLEAAEQRQNVRVESGDAVLLHTGLSAHRAEHPDWDMNVHGSPGWDASCLPWLFERQVAAIGTDGNNEALPNAHVDIWQHPIHAVGIRAMGLTLLNSCRLDQLAATCRELNRWTFLLVVSPLLFRGATGSPVNPLVIL